MNCKKCGAPSDDGEELCQSCREELNKQPPETDTETIAYGCEEIEYREMDIARLKIICIFAAILAFIFLIMYGGHNILYIFSPKNYVASALRNTYIEVRDDYYNQKRVIPKLSEKHLKEYTITAAFNSEDGGRLTLRAGKSDKNKEFFGKIIKSDGVENSKCASFFLNDSKLGVNFAPQSKDYLTVPAVLTAEEWNACAFSEYFGDINGNIDISYSGLGGKKRHFIDKVRRITINGAQKLWKRVKCSSKETVPLVIDGKNIKVKKLTIVCGGDDFKIAAADFFDKIKNDEKIRDDFSWLKIPEINESVNFDDVTAAVYVYKKTAVGAELSIPVDIDGSRTDYKISLMCDKTENRMLNSVLSISENGARSASVKVITGAEYKTGVYKYSADMVINSVNGNYDISGRIDYDKTHKTVEGSIDKDGVRVLFDGTVTKDRGVLLELPNVRVTMDGTETNGSFLFKAEPGMTMKRDRNAELRNLIDMSAENLKNQITDTGVFFLKSAF